MGNESSAPSTSKEKSVSEICCLCLGSKPNNKHFKLPCSHIFCKDCLFFLLSEQDTCGVCRSTVPSYYITSLNIGKKCLKCLKIFSGLNIGQGVCPSCFHSFPAYFFYKFDNIIEKSCRRCYTTYKGDDRKLVSSFPCRHEFCRKCVISIIKEKGFCPLCFVELPANFISEFDSFLEKKCNHCNIAFKNTQKKDLTLFPCNHEFCTNCVGILLSKQETCPSCGASIPDSFISQFDSIIEKKCEKCSTNFKGGEKKDLIQLPCSHLFCKKCLGRIFSEQETCPSCEASIPDSFISQFDSIIEKKCRKCSTNFKGDEKKDLIQLPCSHEVCNKCLETILSEQEACPACGEGLPDAFLSQYDSVISKSCQKCCSIIYFRTFRGLEKELMKLYCSHEVCKKCLGVVLSQRGTCPLCLEECASCSCIMKGTRTDNFISFPCGHTFCIICAKVFTPLQKTCPKCAEPFPAAVIHQLNEKITDKCWKCLKVCKGREQKNMIKFSCKHKFCKDCSNPLLATQNTCPVLFCGKEIRPSFKEASDEPMLKKCSKCSTNFKESEKRNVVKFPCKDFFCKDCARMIVSEQSTCPTCGRAIPEYFMSKVEKMTLKQCEKCLNIFESSKKENFIKLPCNHAFCIGCAVIFLAIENTCPLCKETVPLSVVDEFKELTAEKCLKCLKVFKGREQKNLIRFPCKHMFCEGCANIVLTSQNTCLECNIPLGDDLTKIKLDILALGPSRMNSTIEKYPHSFELVSDRWYYVGITGQASSKRLYIQNLFNRKLILQLIHNDGHKPLREISKEMKKRFWWPGCEIEALKYVRNCEVCKSQPRDGNRDLEGGEVEQSKTTNVGKLWSVNLDIFGPFEESPDNVILMEDNATNFFFFERISETKVEYIIDWMKTIFLSNGLPSFVSCSKSPYFLSDKFRAFALANGIDLVYPSEDQMNDAVEGGSSTAEFKRKLRKEKNLTKFLVEIYNTNNIVSPTGISPLKAFFG